MLEIRLFGQFGVKLDGKPVEIASRPAQSLLAYLALNAGFTHRREKLAGLLWPDAAEANARRSLRQALYQLRKSLDADKTHYILADDISLSLDQHAPFWLDAAELERKLSAQAAVEDLLRAVSVYAGELLPGFQEEWVFLERERLAAEFESKMGCLVDQLVAAGRWSDVREWAERWVALGRVPEPAFRALMLAHSAMGDRSSVMTAYQRCVDAMRRDLDVEPSEQTRLLFNQLIRGVALPAGTGSLSARPAAQSVVNRAPPVEHNPPRTEASGSQSEAPAPGRPPYKGLQHFDEADEALFFGREALVGRLVQRLQYQRFLAIVGASGSGKSSIVRAGIIPALRRGLLRDNDTRSADSELHWLVRVMTPTAHPLEMLALTLTRGRASMRAVNRLTEELASDARSLHLYASGLVDGTQGEPGGQHEKAARLLLVVDQFEELFTLCRSEEERRSFVDNLLYAVSPEASGKIAVVLTLRADFYAHCAQYAGLREALATSQEYIGPMTIEAIRQTIEGPARAGGWELEEGLADLILRDVGGEPGALPLLSHALLETWNARQGRTLTLRGYAASGGVRSAVARTAERVYQELAPEQQTVARSIFLRLTQLGEGTQDTRRQAALSELGPRVEDRGIVEAVLRILVDARLVTVSANLVEVAHEALIREWPTLRRWLEEDRENLRLHRHLTEAAYEWERRGRDAAELYRGTRLAQVLEWADTHPYELNAQEHEFLEAARRQANQEAADREAQRQRELAAAAALTEAQRERAEAFRQAAATLRRRALYLAGALVLVLAMTGVALFFAAQANRSAKTAESNFVRSEAQRLAAEAAALLQSDGNSELIALLTIRSLNTQYSPQGDIVLGQASALNFPQLLFTGHSDSLLDIAFSPDGRWAATGSVDGTARLWEAATGQEVRQFTGHTAAVRSVVFSPDGHYLATGSEDSTVRLWDVETGQALAEFTGHTALVHSVDFSPDGQYIASGSGDATARIWEVPTGQPVGKVLEEAGAVEAVAFTPDGRYLASGGLDGTAQLWDFRTGAAVVTFVGHGGRVSGLDVSPDGQYVVTGSVDKTARLWDAATGEELREFAGHEATVFEAVFSPDGRYVLTGSEDRTARLWDTATGQQLTLFTGHTASVVGLAFSPNGEALATASADSTARMWYTVPRPAARAVTGHAAQIWGVAYSPDGQYIATSSVDKTARLWDAQTGQLVRQFVGHTAEVYGLAFSADSRFLATGSLDGTARLWEVSSGREVRQFAAPDRQALGGVAISPDGRWIVTGGDDKLGRVWDIETGRVQLTLAGHTAGLNLIAYSPDGNYVATASSDSTVRLWNARTGEALHVLAGHSGFVTSVAFSPDSRLVASASADKAAIVWDVQTGLEVRRYLGHVDLVWGVVFSPDGRTIATASGDGTARIWDMATGAELRRLAGHTAGLEGVAFAPDGQRLVTVSDDGTFRFWDVDYRVALQHLCAHLLRDLSPEERAQYAIDDPAPTCPGQP